MCTFEISMLKIFEKKIKKKNREKSEINNETYLEITEKIKNYNFIRGNLSKLERSFFRLFFFFTFLRSFVERAKRKYLAARLVSPTGSV